jgi:hypothetical protein
MQERKGTWWQLPQHQHSTIAVLWKGRQIKQEDVFMVVVSTTSPKTVFFCKNGQATRKTKIGDHEEEQY